MYLSFVLYIFPYLMIFHLCFFNIRKRNFFLSACKNFKNNSPSNIEVSYSPFDKAEDRFSGNIFIQIYLKYTKIIFEKLNFDVNKKHTHNLSVIDNLAIYTKKTDSNETFEHVMAQNYSMKPSYIDRIEALRNVMKKNNIDVYVVINNDEHHSEIINDKDKRVYYLSNYSGADGILIITRQGKPILYVNALYELQANNELDLNTFTLKISKISSPYEIYNTISSLEFNSIAFDGKNTSVDFFEKLKNAIIRKHSNKIVEDIVIYGNNFDDLNQNNKINLLILENSLVEIKDFEVNNKKVFIHDTKFNGSSVDEKINKMKKKFLDNNDKVNNILISELDEIAYFLNLRGYDYKTSPLFYSYLLFQFNLYKKEIDKIILFTIINNLTEEVKKHLANNNIIVYDYHNVIDYLKNNVSTKNKNKKGNDKNIRDLADNADKNPEETTYDISLSPFINLIIYKLFDKKNVLLKKSPIVLMKAIKNDIEIENMKVAHILDALALLQFFYWTNEKKKTKELFQETEISLKNKIDYYRYKKNNFIINSFSTISAIGSNAAVIHYEPTELKNAKISPSIYLLDSGGHYLHGTTDVTRTTHFGVPTEEEKKAYTLVLKGHLHLRKVIFASYTNSIALDFLARSYLYKNYMDYNHGTGHGVGLALNVHEGGCSISPMNGTPLKRNMVLSNEPGYYLKNKFGIRIENMQYVIIKKTTEDGEYLSFNDLTLYPYDKKLIDFSILTPEEIMDINEYHNTIRKTLLPFLKENSLEYHPQIIEYLIEITEPIVIN